MKDGERVGSAALEVICRFIFETNDAHRSQESKQSYPTHRVSVTIGLMKHATKLWPDSDHARANLMMACLLRGAGPPVVGFPLQLKRSWRRSAQRSRCFKVTIGKLLCPHFLTTFELTRTGTVSRTQCEICRNLRRGGRAARRAHRLCGGRLMMQDNNFSTAQP